MFAPLVKRIVLAGLLAASIATLSAASAQGTAQAAGYPRLSTLRASLTAYLPPINRILSRELTCCHNHIFQHRVLSREQACCYPRVFGKHVFAYTPRVLSTRVLHNRELFNGSKLQRGGNVASRIGNVASRIGNAMQQGGNLAQ